MEITNKEFAIVFELLHGYLKATYTSESASVEVFKQILTEVAVTAKADKVERVMIVSNNPEKLNQVDMFRVITECVPFYFGIKVALYYLYPTHVEVDKFDEMIAQNRGIDAKYFIEMKLAEEWVQEN